MNIKISLYSTAGYKQFPCELVIRPWFCCSGIRCRAVGHPRIPPQHRRSMLKLGVGEVCKPEAVISNLRHHKAAPLPSVFLTHPNSHDSSASVWFISLMACHKRVSFFFFSCTGGPAFKAALRVKPTRNYGLTSVLQPQKGEVPQWSVQPRPTPLCDRETSAYLVPFHQCQSSMITGFGSVADWIQVERLISGALIASLMNRRRGALRIKTPWFYIYGGGKTRTNREQR